MEEEIDLRPYIEALLGHWYWVVGTAVLAAVAALITTSFISPTYEATALVAIIEARDIVQFDARIRETDNPQPLNAFPQLALSDQIMASVLSDVAIEGVENVEQLRERLTAEAGSDASLIELTATSQSPTEAADIANGWANIFVNWANEVYGDTSEDQVQFFETQLMEAEGQLTAAEEALIDYQAVNQQLLATNSLDALSLTQIELLDTEQTLARLIQNTQALRNQLETYGGNNSVTLADQLTALFLQMQAFNPTFIEETAVPVQFQLDANGPLTSQNREEQIDLLDSLLQTLSVQSAQIETDLAEMEPQLLALQQQKQQAETYYNRLMRQQVVSEETYTALARKVEEERISSSDTNSGVRLASKAAVPEKAFSPRKRFNTIAAGTMGLMLGVIIVLTVEWWQTSKNNQHRTSVEYASSELDSSVSVEQDGRVSVGAPSDSGEIKNIQPL